jgi:hypothetical protein
MKLSIKFDMLRRIEEAKGQFKLQNTMLDNVEYGVKLFTVYVVLNTIFGRTIDYTLSHSAMWTGVVYSFKAGLSHILNSTINSQFIAFSEIFQLSLELNKINVSTDVELMADAEEYHREYKIVFNEGIIPKILQNKYILVPTYAEGEIKETSVLQEHIIGSKKYFLSKGSPAKQYKLAFSAG